MRVARFYISFSMSAKSIYTLTFLLREPPYFAALFFDIKRA
jgi:hypothetical protein